jgi:hypothetical protein
MGVLTMKPSRVLHVALLLGVSLVCMSGCGSKETETAEDEAAPSLPAPNAQPRRTAPEYKIVEGTEGGIRQATLYAHKVPSLGSTLEVRSVLVLPKKSALLADRETLYEVLRGEVESVSGDERKSHGTGDLWMVSKGARVTLRAKGEIAVLRAISVSGK